jgi:hypothetical protein
VTGLIDVLRSLDEGARLTGACLDARYGATPVVDRCLVAHFVELPDGSQVETESRFISQHLGLAAAGIHGMQMDGSQWLLVLQAAPHDDAESGRPYAIMSEEWLRLLELTVGWRSFHVGDWIPRAILRPYMFAGLGMDDMLDWSLRDVVGGPICELVGTTSSGSRRPALSGARSRTRNTTAGAMPSMTSWPGGWHNAEHRFAEAFPVSLSRSSIRSYAS